MRQFLHINKISKSIAILGIAMLFSCSNTVKDVSIFIEESDTIPDVTATDVNYVRSDSGRVQATLISPLMYKFEDEKDPYLEFPEGLKVVFYDTLKQVQSELIADYGVNYEKQKLMEVKGNVIIKNLEKQESLYTEHLVWDQRKKMIYSEVQVKITRPEEVLYGDGLNSDESFNEYEIFKPRGTIEVEEEEDDR